jgi:hypothetical protein
MDKSYTYRPPESPEDLQSAASAANLHRARLEEQIEAVLKGDVERVAFYDVSPHGKETKVRVEERQKVNRLAVMRLMKELFETERLIRELHRASTEAKGVCGIQEVVIHYDGP